MGVIKEDDPPEVKAQKWRRKDAYAQIYGAKRPEPLAPQKKVSLWHRLVQVSTILQFSAAKAGMVFSGITMSTTLSIKFGWPWLLTTIGVGSLGLLFAAFVYFAGWARKEYEYGAALGFTAKLDEANARLERIEKKLLGEA